MSKDKPGIPKGTRDFSPEEMARRNHIFNTIRTVFSLYGYQPIETPAMENLNTLLGKYGEEGDKLLFKILNSGDYLKDIATNEINSGNTNALSVKLCEKGLRYDLTVPFARYVVQHQNEIAFPFKRYQIQPVWRADRPQKGRYREFYQCDADVIGSPSLLNEVELLMMVDEVFRRLGLSITVKLNNRKILRGIAETIGLADRITDITVAIDKIEKVGIEAVNSELRGKGIPDSAIASLNPIITLTGNNQNKIQEINRVLCRSEVGIAGANELLEILDCLATAGKISAGLEIDLSLARGLNYYTGTIIEVKANDVQIGSICGGGRYDDLTGIFGLRGVSGVGISFGADRIYDVMMQLNLFPANLTSSSQVLFTNLGPSEARYSLPLAQEIRALGVSAELYPESAKLRKQLDYANRRNIAIVAIAGESELAANAITLKHMTTGKQETVPLTAMASLIHSLLSQTTP